MSFKEQLKTLKNNWLLVLLPIVLIIVLSGAGNMFSSVGELSFAKSQSYDDYAPAMMRADFMPSPIRGGDFAPEIKNRLIAKTARLSAEVEHGKFNDAVTKLKSLLASSAAFLLNENVNTHESGTKKEYTVGSFDIKVESTKYASLVSELKTIGKVLSFTENADDITGAYTDVQSELENEKKRLQRYNAMHANAVSMEDKINLVDRIFNLESRIKYLENNVANLGKQVSYSTINVYISEKKSEYLDIEFVKLPALAADFVSSINGLLSLVIALLPWAVALWIVVLLVRFFRKK